MTLINFIVILMMGLYNDQLIAWCDRNTILNEYQDGFEKNYSIVYNIYNLSAIVQINSKNNIKTYALLSISNRL